MAYTSLPPHPKEYYGIGCNYLLRLSWPWNDYKGNKGSKFFYFCTMFDPVRKKEVAHTPEEEVRQALVAHLHNVCGAPYALMCCEYRFKAGRKIYRADLVLFDKKGQPLLLAECKAPSIPVDRSVFEQIIRYNQWLKVPYLLLTNGTDSYLCRHYPQGNRLEALTQIPSYIDMIHSTKISTFVSNLQHEYGGNGIS